jgi:creatinine amidohydrolase
VEAISEPVEQRFERLHPAELEALVTAAPIAWVPVGTLEFHGPHLPFGVDAFESHGLLRRAAARAGGVVLPPTYLACSCLDMPYTLSFSHEVVAASVRETIEQLANRGFRAVVVLAGHCPLDLVHLLKRVCAEASAGRDDLAAYGCCWLELNAAGLTGPQEGEPQVVDHAAMVETSWMLALEPDLVHLDRLADDPEATHAGVYGRNPRFTASADWGRSTVAAAAALLARRATDLLAGEMPDDLADLRRFVAYSWPEPLAIAGAADDDDTTLIGLHNPGRSSRYISALAVTVDDGLIDPAHVELINLSPGETGVPVTARTLGAEAGFYVRRDQTATLRLPALAPGEHRLRLDVGLGGVATVTVEGDLEVAAAPASEPVLSDTGPR